MADFNELVEQLHAGCQEQGGVTKEFEDPESNQHACVNREGEKMVVERSDVLLPTQTPGVKKTKTGVGLEDQDLTLEALTTNIEKIESLPQKNELRAVGEETSFSLRFKN